MNKIYNVLGCLTFILTLVSCETVNDIEGGEINSPNIVKVRLFYDLSSANGESMKRCTAATGAEAYSFFYSQFNDLIAPTYNITFTNSTSGEQYHFTGSWIDNNIVTLRVGTYNVTGYSKAEGIYIQEKCSVIFSDVITVADSTTSVALNANYDCSLLIFNKDNIASLTNNTVSENSSFYSKGDYWYAFVNDCIYGESDSYILGKYSNGNEFVAKTQGINFTKGKYYYYKDIQSFINFLQMEEGDVEFSNHEYVDLGLSSGTLWATCNIGASSPEEYGDYFFWGEIEPAKEWRECKYYMGNAGTARDLMTKYTTRDSYSYYGVADNLTELAPEDDAATQIWGDTWRIPSEDNMKELVTECTWTWTTLNGVRGYNVKGCNGNHIFIPASGSTRWSETIAGLGDCAALWTSTLYGQSSFDGDNYAYSLYYTSSKVQYNCKVGRVCDRECIRPIYRR